MWKPSELGTLILSREFQLEREKTDSSVVRLFVGAPLQAPATEDDSSWFCPFQIEGLSDKPRFEYGRGWDSMDAMVWALRLAGDFLPHMAEKAGGQLSWIGYSQGEVNLVFGPHREKVE